MEDKGRAATTKPTYPGTLGFRVQGLAPQMASNYYRVLFGGESRIRQVKKINCCEFVWNS